jgi:hypothetical protein
MQSSISTQHKVWCSERRQLLLASSCRNMLIVLYYLTFLLLTFNLFKLKRNVKFPLQKFRLYSLGVRQVWHQRVSAASQPSEYASRKGGCSSDTQANWHSFILLSRRMIINLPNYSVSDVALISGTLNSWASPTAAQVWSQDTRPTASLSFRKCPDESARAITRILDIKNHDEQNRSYPIFTPAIHFQLNRFILIFSIHSLVFGKGQTSLIG